MQRGSSSQRRFDMKRILALLLVAVVAAGAVFASVDLKLALGGQSNGNIEISDRSTQFDFTVDAELDMDFNRGHGMLVGLVLTKSDIAMSVGYAYQTDISSSCDFILGAGATVVIKDPVELNYFVTADFDFHVTQDMFVRLGTGVLLNLGALNDNYGKDWSITIPLPSLAIGWHF